MSLVEVFYNGHGKLSFVINLFRFQIVLDSSYLNGV